MVTRYYEESRKFCTKFSHHVDLVEAFKKNGIDILNIREDNIPFLAGKKEVEFENQLRLATLDIELFDDSLGLKDEIIV